MLPIMSTSYARRAHGKKAAVEDGGLFMTPERIQRS
jgi:hypothetical protein